ncbi:asparagine synthase-related protein [Nonomuraea sp. NPDC046570]|uniref:asparagine synthase-related protein n=1 Tax=Nonomuraea sp. NPDC046570 TaxID=3155255 RepID=UPI003400DB66
MLSHRAAIPLSARTLNRLAALIRAHRAERRSRWRRLDPGPLTGVRVQVFADRGYQGAGGTIGAFDLATLAELRASADTQCFMRELAQRYGVAVHAPYLDNEVVRACLAAPVFDQVDAGVPKPLLSSALRGLVSGRPRSLRGTGARRSGGDGSPDRPDPRVQRDRAADVSRVGGGRRLGILSA